VHGECVYVCLRCAGPVGSALAEERMLDMCLAWVKVVLTVLGLVGLVWLVHVVGCLTVAFSSWSCSLL
jgi:hypothetical protein